ncbi:hypothetical protein Cgig2_007796 [Carnegiea gigantea]|uniref:Uncharacterized protein n=1 Tax=Carnegiea gigantea TaxID=171969 RepID=A0A9Q1GPN1_9CARY|nr:hypothetical protein Cgig2_007796 [Carnegiea gigantea]
MADLGKEERMVGEKEEEERLIEGVAVLDFDVLCSTVASQSQGKWRLLENEEEGEVGGGVLRMWEGEVLDCFDDHRIAIESACCPCYRFGKNMRRAGLGPCFLQGTVYFLLVASAFLNCIAFTVTRRHRFLYLAIAFTLSLAAYLGFFRTQIRKKFNIGVSRPYRIYFHCQVLPVLIFGKCSQLQVTDSAADDFLYHLICPCCAISQESRTLEMNNVQGGTWHGRGDTICVGTFGDGSKAFVDLHPPPRVAAHEPSTRPISVSDNNEC